MVTAAAVKNGVISEELKVQLSQFESHFQPDNLFILVSLCYIAIRMNRIFEN